MAVNTAKFLLADLDFDQINASLQNYLSSQSQYTDYNFPGSNLSVLMGLLAYNSHYLGYYLNMVANELYMDSADLRESVVSIAKSLNYTPYSRHSARAVVNIKIVPPPSPTPSANLVINANTRFTTSIDGTTYTFVNPDAITVSYDSTNNWYLAQNVTLVEGLPFTLTFTVDNSVPGQRFVIPNANVDTDTITVQVQNSATDSTISTFVLADNVNILDSNAQVYFLQEVEDMKYEVYFGDGVLGQALVDGNVVLITYQLSSADAPNQAAVFTAAGPIGGIGNITVTTVTPAFGGAERESIDSIKFSAPKSYEAQNRAVTASDYKTLLLRDYPNAQSVAVWGGQDAIPPQYGKVFISIKPVDGFVLTNNEKQNIVGTILQKYNVMSVIPVIVDPDYIYVAMNCTVKYDPTLTTNSAEQIKAMVISTISAYNSNDLSQFNSTFRFSNLMTQIDNTEPSILNNLTKITIQKRFVPRLDVADTYTINFNANNPISPGTVQSSNFIVTSDPSFPYTPGDIHGFEDDGQGNIRIFKLVGTSHSTVKAKAGTVNYATGMITLSSFVPHLVCNAAGVVDPTSTISVNVIPQVSDVTPMQNNIVVIDPASLMVNMQTSASAS